MKPITPRTIQGWRGALLLALVALLALPLSSARPDGQQGQPKADPVEQLLAGKTKLDGFQTIWTGDGQAYLELSGGDFDKPFLCMSSIGRGIATGGFVNGMTLSTEVLAFQQGPNETIRLISRNVRFKRPDGPLQKAFDLSFHDSPIMVLEPAAKSGGRTLIDLGDIFIAGDYSGMRGSMRGLSFQSRASYFGSVKVFPTNTELRANMLFTSSMGGSVGPAISDPRGAEVVVHYSLSKMPEGGYKPRVADDRVGYFTSVHYDFTNAEDNGFIRFINRWRLEKADDKKDVSPAKNSVIFWIENTVPWEYRPWIRDALEAWNRAFEAAGIRNAIEVRQMPDDADWDPEDARYNTIRWTAAYNMGFAIGPSRVNPLTGEILDADILIDANFVRYFERDFRLSSEPTGGENEMPFEDRKKILHEMMRSNERITPDAIKARMSPKTDDFNIADELSLDPQTRMRSHCSAFDAKLQRVRLAGVAHALEPARMTAVNEEGLPKDLIGRALKDLVMHEVGHTLGLRHNFRASTLRSVEELKDKSIVDDKGFVASVMDYLPLFVTADPERQGYFNPPDIGPYDVWAIRYGYTPTDDDGLKKIASEAADPNHIYGTDEDSYGAFGVDPYCRVWDAGREPLDYAVETYTLVKRLWKQDWDKVAKLNPRDRVGVRTGFLSLLNEHYRATMTATDFIGGVRGYRHRSTDPGAKNPIEPVSREQMDRALQLILTESLGANAFDFPREVVKQLAPSRWGNWGENESSQLYIRVADEILFERLIALVSLHSTYLLSALDEIALMDDNALSPEEIWLAVTNTVWSGLDSGTAIPTDRRALQSEHLSLLMAIWNDATYPTRGRLLARVMLTRIRDGLNAANVGNHAASQIHVEGLKQLVTDCLNAQPTRSAR